MQLGDIHSESNPAFVLHLRSRTKAYLRRGWQAAREVGSVGCGWLLRGCCGTICRTREAAQPMRELYRYLLGL
jgi:hypothetical protein